jgi:hypothetical protein
MGIGNPVKLDQPKRLTELEVENARLRKVAANLSTQVLSLQAAVGRSSRSRSGDYLEHPARQLRLLGPYSDQL